LGDKDIVELFLQQASTKLRISRVIVWNQWVVKPFLDRTKNGPPGASSGPVDE
jgi:hypothetical protein